jgi:hypothetical protein
VRNVLRDFEVGVLSRVYAFARRRLAGLSQVSERHSWASAGSRVFHQKFGRGAILLVQDNKLLVFFDGLSEPKLVVDSFCEPVFDAYDRNSPKAFSA